MRSQFSQNFQIFRKEQLKMQQDGNQVSAKEKLFFFPTTFDKLESIVKDGFIPNMVDQGVKPPVSDEISSQGVLFFPDSQVANETLKGIQRVFKSFSLMSLFWVGNENPRVIVMAKVMVGVCHLLPEEEGAASRPLKVRLNSVKNSQGKRVDSFTNEEKTFFIKTLMTETYPEAVLIYRDKSGSSDSRTSRITDVVKSGCLVSYRAGTRYNPEEAKFRADEVRPTANHGRQPVKAKRPKKVVNENDDPNGEKSPKGDKSSQQIENKSPEDEVVVIIHAEKGTEPSDFSDTGAKPKRITA